MGLSLNIRRPGGGAWSEQFHKEIAKLSELPREADSWSPRRPSSQAFRKAEELAQAIARSGLPLPAVVATGENGIQMKWRKGRRELSFFVGADASIEYLFVPAEDRIEDGSLAHAREAKPFVDRLLA